MNQRIIELDGIRGIAILMVVFYHYITCQEKVPDPESLLAYLHLLSTVFWSGVDLFFVLSGFLIGGIILDNHSRRDFLKTFWIRRICRIFPVLFLLLFLCYATGSVLDHERFEWLFQGLMPWWTYPTFTQNLAMGFSHSYGGNFLGITWSLAVEEQFYLLAPLLMVCLGRKRFLRCLVPLILLAFLLRLMIPGYHCNVNTFFRMDSLLVGVLVSAVFRAEAAWKVLLQNRSVVLLVFICLLGITHSLVMEGGFGQFKFSWFAILYAMFLLVALLFQSTRLTWLLRSNVLCFCGTIAYGLYMYHQAVSGLLHGWFLGAAPSLMSTEAVFITCVAIVLSFTLSWISLKAFESHFLKIGQRYRYGDSEPQDGSS